MFCLICGYPLKNGHTGCDYCGEKIDGNSKKRKDIDNEAELAQGKINKKENPNVEEETLKSDLSKKMDKFYENSTEEFGEEDIHTQNTIQENDSNDNINHNLISEDDFSVHAISSNNGKNLDNMNSNDMNSNDMNSNDMNSNDSNNKDVEMFLNKFVNKTSSASPTDQIQKGKSDGQIPNNSNKNKKSFLTRLGLVLGIILVISFVFFTTYKRVPDIILNNANDYINLETTNLEQLLKSYYTDNQKIMSMEINELVGNNSNSRMEFRNFDLDVKSFEKLGFPDPKKTLYNSKYMNIVWDKKSLPKNNTWYNDIVVNVKNGEFIRLQSLKRDNILKIMVPSIYPKAFQIDTRDLVGFYKNIGISEKEGYFESVLRENEYITALTVNENISQMVSELKKLLDIYVNEKNATITKGVKASIGDVMIDSNKIQVTFSEEQVKSLLKLIIEKLATDSDMFKEVVGKYIIIADLIKQLNLDDGRLDSISKDSFREYISSLRTSVDNLKIENGGNATIWVDKNNTIVSRNYEFTVKSENGSARIAFHNNNLNSDEKKFTGIQFICEANTEDFRNIEIKTEKTILKEQFNSTKNIIDSTKLLVGNPNQKGYLSFEILSDKNYQSEVENKRRYSLDFSKKDDKDLKININASGKELGKTGTKNVNGDYTIDYEILADNVYKGKFDVKYDTKYEEVFDLPIETSPILSDNLSIINLNEIDKDARSEMYFDVQLKYKVWQNKLVELLNIGSDIE